MLSKILHKWGKKLASRCDWQHPATLPAPNKHVYFLCGAAATMGLITQAPSVATVVTQFMMDHLKSKKEKYLRSSSTSKFIKSQHCLAWSLTLKQRTNHEIKC